MFVHCHGSDRPSLRAMRVVLWAGVVVRTTAATTTTTETQWDFNVMELFERPLYDADYDFTAFLQEWQAILGLVVLLTTWCATCFLTACVACCQKKTNKVQIQSVVISVSRLWESCALFLLLFAMLKHSPQVAILEVLIYFQFPCWNMMFQAFQAINKRGLHEESDAKVPRLSPVSVYTDLHGGSIFECLAMFAVQVMLYLLVAGTVYDQGKFDDFSDQQVFFYVCGAFVSAVLRLREHSFLHSEYIPFWKPYFEEFVQDDHRPLLRLVCSLLVNQVFSQSVLTLLPVILMNSPDLMEFVKDATCVAFISRMDDLLNIEEDHVMINGPLMRKQQEKDFKEKLQDLVGFAQMEILKASVQKLEGRQAEMQKAMEQKDSELKGILSREESVKNELWRSQQELFIVKSKVGNVEKLASKSQEELLELLHVVKSLKEEKDKDVEDVKDVMAM